MKPIFTYFFIVYVLVFLFCLCGRLYKEVFEIVWRSSVRHTDSTTRISKVEAFPVSKYFCLPAKIVNSSALSFCFVDRVYCENHLLIIKI